jgi:peptidoglycan DL-endopeptidase CwlO
MRKVSVLPRTPTSLLRPGLVAAIAAAALFPGVPSDGPPAVAPAPAGPAVVPTAAARPAPAALPVPTAVAPRASALRAALSKIGRPYRYGASGPSAFDCSGLVYWSYRQAGVSLPRSSRAMSSVGKPVPRSALQPGDLVFFYRPVSHVGIYVGEGKVVHASTYGQPVKISPIGRMPFNSARRI